MEKNQVMEEALMGLLQKYGIEVNRPFSLDRNATSVRALTFLPGYALMDSVLSKGDVPLLFWRMRRSFVELKKTVEEEVIGQVCLQKFSFITSAEKWSLPKLIYREADLCEYLGGGKIKSVFAVRNQNYAVNIIVRLNTDVLCSIELSLQLPDKTDSQEMHEIIGHRGTASDRVVDTQILQHSLYCFTQAREKNYTDTDAELFGFDPIQIEQIRAAFEIYKNPDLASMWVDQHLHLINVVKAVLASGEKHQKVIIP